MPRSSALMLGVSSTVILVLLLSRAPSARGQETDPHANEAEARATKLIEQLGADDYATREQAQARLKAMGLSAFDALLSAAKHTDIEVATRVRYLLRGMPVAWARDLDPQSVKSILRTYGQAGREDRINRMQMLAGLEDSLGVEALCRIVRYEVDPALSKRAALELLRHQKAPAADRPAVAEKILRAISGSRRPAIDWLATYAASLTDPQKTLESWRRITRDELEVWTETPEETQRDVVRDLLRWHVDFLVEIDRKDDAQAALAGVFEVVEGKFADLYDLVDWATTRQMWSVSEELAARFPSVYRKNAGLMYRLAEGRRKLGNEAGAQEAATEALALDPRDLTNHFIRGRFLRERMMAFDWAENEFSYVIQESMGQPEKELTARRHYADMLFDLEREADAAEMAGGIVAILMREDGTEFELRESRSYAAYYDAIHQGRQGNYAKQRELLLSAYEGYSENIDIVIAMYQVQEADDAWRRATLDRLQVVVQRTREQRDAALELFRRLNDRDGQAKETLAQKNNELAWLISNTTGDYEEALQCSQESLKLQPEQWAYLDTLGRCYYALGDYENAVQAQKKATAGAPYMQQMQRQLKLFEDALAAKNKAS